MRVVVRLGAPERDHDEEVAMMMMMTRDEKRGV